jgi:hypothetical protein
MVSGSGYTVSFPAGWEQKRTELTHSASRGSSLVSVSVLPLRRRYRPELFAKVVPELDRVAGDFASRQGGSVTDSRTVVAAGARSRQYDLLAGNSRERVTFVLRGRREFQLLCRWQGNEPEACDLLTQSFRTIGAAPT